MRRVVLLWILLLITSYLPAQENPIYVGARLGRLDIDNFSPRPYYGIDIDAQLGNNFAFQWSILAGQNYFHMPLGPPIGYIVGLSIANTPTHPDSTSDKVFLGIVFGILTALIPESVSYEFRIHQNLSLAPYVSPLQLEFIKDFDDPEREVFAGGGLGLRTHFYLVNDKLRLTPYCEYKIHYTSAVNGGLSYGLCFSFDVRKSP
jgi:hypothetical protein